MGFQWSPVFGSLGVSINYRLQKKSSRLFIGSWLVFPFFQHKGDSFHSCLIIFLLFSSLSIFGLHHWESCMSLLCEFVGVFFLLFLLCHVSCCPLWWWFVCFPGASLTRSHPPRAAGRRHYSVFMWRRDTVKLFYVLTALTTCCSQDPKVNAHNPPSFLPSFTSWL